MPAPTLLPLAIKPGAWRNGTRYEAFGRWYEVSQVRWTNGRLRPIGGWKKFSETALAEELIAPARALHAWRGNDFSRYLAIGTSKGIFIHDNNELKDMSSPTFVSGRGNSIYGLGWGAGAYGMDAYGTARAEPSSIVLDAATWTLDNFGEVLVGVCTSDGFIWQWEPSQFSLADGNELATRVVNAPTGVSAVFVTEERHLVALGATDNPRQVAWSSRENLNEWTATSLNTAGDQDVTTAGRLLAGARWRGGSVLFTDVDVHLMTYEGSPLIYGIEQISGAAGLVGPGAAASTGDRVVWMSPTGFWQYDGVAAEIPCDIHEHIFRDINILQGAKISAGVNSAFGEVWWFYPAATSVENDRYVIWSYKEGWWSYGSLDRTAWLDAGVWGHCVASDSAGNLYQHEDGWTADGATRVGSVYAKSGAIELGKGERFTEVRQLIPDAQDDPTACTVSFTLRENPQSEPFATAGPYTLNQANGYFDDARFSARQIEMTVEAAKDADFTLGTLRADVTAGSGR